MVVMNSPIAAHLGQSGSPIAVHGPGGQQVIPTMEWTATSSTPAPKQGDARILRSWSAGSPGGTEEVDGEADGAQGLDLVLDVGRDGLGVTGTQDGVGHRVGPGA